MTITFYSNYLNHHQIPLCNALYNLLGDGFTFVETEPMETERLNLGWGINQSHYPYCIQVYDNIKNQETSLRLAKDSDIIILGSAPELYMQTRIKTGKPALRYAESFFRRGNRAAYHPRAILAFLRHHTRWRAYPLYMLCASAYTAYDCARGFAYPEKLYKWGYFPEIKEYDIENLLSLKGKTPVKILWVGRFMHLKHPEAAVKAAEYLSMNNIDYELNFIGDGERLEQVREMARGEGDRICFLGTMKPTEVRTHMENADIFLFTSDFQEGWGVVLNEAMNSGCAVVASHAAGAAPFLINHGINGFMYENGNMNALCSYVERLARDLTLRRRLGAAAYETVSGEWSAQNAAQRFVDLCEGILADKRETVYFENGPCSKADIIDHKYRI